MLSNHNMFWYYSCAKYTTKLFSIKSSIMVRCIHLSYNFNMSIFIWNYIALQSDKGVSNAVYDKGEQTWQPVDYNNCWQSMIPAEWLVYRKMCYVLNTAWGDWHELWQFQRLTDATQRLSKSLYMSTTFNIYIWTRQNSGSDVNLPDAPIRNYDPI
jgi:hypothetical protein